MQFSVIFSISSNLFENPVGNYVFKINNRNT